MNIEIRQNLVRSRTESVVTSIDEVLGKIFKNKDYDVTAAAIAYLSSRPSRRLRVVDPLFSEIKLDLNELLNRPRMERVLKDYDPSIFHNYYQEPIISLTTHLLGRPAIIRSDGAKTVPSKNGLAIFYPESSYAVDFWHRIVSGPRMTTGNFLELSIWRFAEVAISIHLWTETEGRRARFFCSLLSRPDSPQPDTFHYRLQFIAMLLRSRKGCIGPGDDRSFFLTP